MASIKIDQLGDEIVKQLNLYSEEVQEKTRKAIKSAAKTVQNEIKANAPKDSGKYSKSWRVKEEYDSGIGLTEIVYSPTRYQLAHLLEHGHAKRNGGRVAARPHIAQAEQAGLDQLERDLTQALKG